MTAQPRLDRLTRKPDRESSSRALLDALLDEVLVGTLSTVLDGQPWVVPLLFARDGDRVLLHGSTGAGALRHVASGAPAAFCVMSFDALVVAESTFESSANYRSSVIRGRLANLSGDDGWAALNRLSDRLLPGRNAEVRPMRDKEVAATVALALPILDGQWIYKERTGPPGEPAPGEDLTGVWTGVVPFRTVRGPAQPAPWCDPALPPPPSVQRLLGEV